MVREGIVVSDQLVVMSTLGGGGAGGVLSATK
jgi:hypothetical protein